MKRNIQIEKCIGKHCRKMVKVDHSMDIPGFAYASGICKKHMKELKPPSTKKKKIKMIDSRFFDILN